MYILNILFKFSKKYKDDKNKLICSNVKFKKKNF